jgi:hypothetical protein
MCVIFSQRYGPPPSYPHLKIPGLNAPIPPGASFGYHPGGWGKPPVDEVYIVFIYSLFVFGFLLYHINQLTCLHLNSMDARCMEMFLVFNNKTSLTTRFDLIRVLLCN